MKLSISSKLKTAFGVLVLISACSSIFSVYMFSSFKRSVATSLPGERSNRSVWLNWMGKLGQFKRETRTIAILKSKDGALKKVFSVDLELTSNRISEIQKELEKADTSVEAQMRLGDIKKKREAYSEFR